MDAEDFFLLVPFCWGFDSGAACPLRCSSAILPGGPKLMPLDPTAFKLNLSKYSFKALLRFLFEEISCGSSLISDGMGPPVRN